MYYGGDKGYGATQFYTIRRDVSTVNFFDTINAPTSTVTDRFDCSSSHNTVNIFTLAFAAPDLGYGSTIFYYLRIKPTTPTLAVFGTLTPGATGVGVSNDLIVTNLTGNFDSLTFAAADVGYGANLFYTLRHDKGTCKSYFGVLNPGTLTWADIMPLAPNFDALFFTEADVGYGINLFYYLRHNPSNTSTFGTIDPVNHNFTDRYVLGKNYNQLTQTATNIQYGPNLFYFIRGAPFTSCIIAPTTTPTPTPTATAKATVSPTATKKATASPTATVKATIKPTASPTHGG